MWHVRGDAEVIAKGRHGGDVRIWSAGQSKAGWRSSKPCDGRRRCFQYEPDETKRLLLVTQRRLAATFMFVKTQKSGRCWGKAHTRTPPSAAIGHRPTLTALGPGDFVEVGPGPFLGRVQWGRQGPAPVDPLQVLRLRCGLSTATFNSTASRFIPHQYRPSALKLLFCRDDSRLEREGVERMSSPEWTIHFLNNIITS